MRNFGIKFVTVLWYSDIFIRNEARLKALWKFTTARYVLTLAFIVIYILQFGMYLSLNSAEENVSNVVLKWNVRISL